MTRLNGRRMDAIVMSVIVLLGMVLRVHLLDGQSFWSDEGISLLRSVQPFGEMLRQMPVEHVPGYFVLLHAWIRVTGVSDYTLRFLSVWPSVLAVALIYRMATDMGGTTASRQQCARISGLAAALLLATGAFQVWYAQEARMYSWLLLASLASGWFLWRLLLQPEGRWWTMAAGYVVSVAACAYTHYYGLLVPLAHTVFALGWVAATRNWRVFARWVGCGAIVLLLFLPWVPRTLGVGAFSGWRDPGQPWMIPWRYLAAYTVGDAMPEPWRLWLPVLYASLAILGAVVWWRICRAASLFLLVNLLVPLAAVVALALRNPDFHERYAIALSGPLILLIAGGLMAFDIRFWRNESQYGAGTPWRAGAISACLLLALVGLNGLALGRHYSDDTFHKPDFKSAAWRIQNEEAPGDVILVDGPDPEKVFLHYYTGPNRVHDLRFLEDESWETVDAYLTAATAGEDVAWELLYFHAPGPVQVWLATRGWATGQSDHNDIRVIKYGLPGPLLSSRELNVPFGSELVLEAAEVTADPLVPGDLLRITSHWFTRQPAPEYKFSLRLIDGTGSVSLSRDYVPQNGFAPTSAWIVDQSATDRRGILLPLDLPVGRYSVTLRLYDPATGVPIETPAGQDVLLGEIDVNAPNEE